MFIAIINCQITCCRLSSSHKIGSAGIAGGVLSVGIPRCSGRSRSIPRSTCLSCSRASRWLEVLPRQPRSAQILTADSVQQQPIAAPEGSEIYHGIHRNARKRESESTSPFREEAIPSADQDEQQHQREDQVARLGNQAAPANQRALPLVHASVSLTISPRVVATFDREFPYQA